MKSFTNEVERLRGDDSLKIYNSHKRDLDANIILSIFSPHCLRCGRYTETIHEIIPRSHGNGARDISNRIPLCNTICHLGWAHTNTIASIPVLKHLRQKRLTQFGFEDA